MDTYVQMKLDLSEVYLIVITVIRNERVGVSDAESRPRRVGVSRLLKIHLLRWNIYKYSTVGDQ